MNFSRAEEDRLDVNITPLIDVVFLLLIFFMVTTTFNQQAELRVDLPEASSEEQAMEVIPDMIGNAEVVQQMEHMSQFTPAFDRIAIGQGSVERHVVFRRSKGPGDGIIGALSQVNRMIQPR